jgi:hypothetical protein
MWVVYLESVAPVVANKSDCHLSKAELLVFMIQLVNRIHLSCKTNFGSGLKKGIAGKLCEDRTSDINSNKGFFGFDFNDK